MKAKFTMNDALGLLLVAGFAAIESVAGLAALAVLMTYFSAVDQLIIENLFALLGESNSEAVPVRGEKSDG